MGSLSITAFGTAMCKFCPIPMSCNLYCPLSCFTLLSVSCPVLCCHACLTCHYAISLAMQYAVSCSVLIIAPTLSFPALPCTLPPSLHSTMSSVSGFCPVLACALHAVCPLPCPPCCLPLAMPSTLFCSLTCPPPCSALGSASCPAL